MMLWNRFKKFDAYVKTVDGVNQQTLLGAIITIVSAILVSILLFSEIILYAKVDVVSRMATDKIGGVESVRLKFDIEFQGISCNRINFQQEVTRGNLHLHEPGQIEKRDIPIETMTGCSVSGNMITDKVGGNFRFHINSAPNAVNDMSQPIPAVRGEDQALPKLDHKINHVSFNHVSLNEEDEKQAYQIIPGLTNSLNDQLTVVADDTNIYHYAIQVKS